MKRKTLARALAMALCLMLCVPAMATSWDWTAGSQTAASDAPASAQYAGDEALTGAAGGIGAYVDGQGGLYLTGYEGTMSQYIL